MLSLIEFKQQLSNFTTTEQIANFIRTFDVSASSTTENSTSVFYTKSIDGDVNNPMWQIANTIQAEGNGEYKVLNNSTDAAFYLNDQNGYRLAILDTLTEITGIDDRNILNNQFFNGRVEKVKTAEDLRNIIRQLDTNTHGSIRLTYSGELNRCVN